MKFAIGMLISHGFPAPTAFWDSYEQLMQHVACGASNEGLPEHLKVEAVRRIKSTAFPVDFARNEIVRDMLRGPEAYLLFLDADMTFPPNLVNLLLRHDVPVVTARYHMRKPPYHAVAYVKHRAHTGPNAYQTVHFGKGLIEIERGGAGALLIRRDVLEGMQFRFGENWFRYQRGPDPPHDYTVSEDFWFYRCAREAGFRVYCDWDTECGHLQEFVINKSWSDAYLDAQVREIPTLAEAERRKVVDNLVVCGYPDGLTLPTGDTVAPYHLQPGER